MAARSELSTRTKETYGREVRRFKRLFRAEFEMEPADATQTEILTYAREVAGKHLQTESSLNVHSVAIRKWYLDTRGAPLELPALRLEKESLPPVLTKEQLHRLFRHTRPHPCGKMIRLIYAGVRLNEVIRVRVGDVDFENCRIMLRDPDDQPWREVSSPAAMRYELFHEAMEKADHDFLFSLRQDAAGRWLPVSSRTVQHFLSEATQTLGIGRISLQTLRENMILRLLRWGVDPRRIAELIGVKNQRSIHRLRRLMPESSIRTVNRLGL